MVISSLTLTILLYERIELFVPSLWDLVETIQIVLQTTNKLYFSFEFKTLMLLHIDIFIKITMKEHNLHIVQPLSLN